MKTTLVTIFCFCCSLSFGQNLPPNHTSIIAEQDRPHNLFAQCIIENTKYVQEIEIPWVEIDDLLVVMFDFKETPGKPTTKWVKRKADENCLSQNPDDCLVWCLIDIMGVDYELDESFEDLSDKSDFFDTKIDVEAMYWQPIMFFDDLEESEQKRIIKKLKKKKFLDKSHPVEWSDEVIAALHQYQKERSIPIGNLNFLTLDELKINY